MIAKITKAYIRHYRDNDQVTAYVEWLDGRGKAGRHEAPKRRVLAGSSSADAIVPLYQIWGVHMAALLDRAERDGVTIERETWT